MWEPDTSYGRLQVGVAYIAAVSYGNEIIIVGGQAGMGDVRDHTQIIDTTTGDASVSLSVVTQPLYGVAPIIVGNVLYAFGGVDIDSMASSDWQSLTLLSNNFMINCKNSFLNINTVFVLRNKFL